jgi:hypothetical protein
VLVLHTLASITIQEDELLQNLSSIMFRKMDLRRRAAIGLQSGGGRRCTSGQDGGWQCRKEDDLRSAALRQKTRF